MAYVGEYLLGKTSAFRIAVVVIFVMAIVSSAGWPVKLLAGLVALSAIPALNYLGWITLGRLVTTLEERQKLAADERAELAWTFWLRAPLKPPPTTPPAPPLSSP